MQKHFYAITANTDKAVSLGFQSDKIFEIWNEIGGRYSVSSSIGGLPLTILFGYRFYEEFQNGSKFMDEIFFNENLIQKNIPSLLAILDSFNDKINGLKVKVICPYTKSLKFLVNHLQQVEMESLGKNYNQDQQRFLQEEELVACFVMGDVGSDC